MKSILAKIRRAGKSYQIGTMDDIGGCRIILKDMEQVREAISILADRFSLKEGNSIKNYIEQPRGSGYRSCHLITTNPGADRDYRVEVQVRTQLQHLWSTAVEAASFIYESDYKAESSSISGTSLRVSWRRLYMPMTSARVMRLAMGGLRAYLHTMM
jgi:ppGpp synthetase/RelA/SpoT-type nucleotidyltranferase